MLTILLGYRTPSAREVPTVLYVGQLPSEARAAAEKSDLPRLELVTAPTSVRVRAFKADAAAPVADEPKPSKPSKPSKK